MAGKPGLYSEQKTNFSAISQTLQLDTREMNTYLITFNGTYSFTALFEASDDGGTTWFPVRMAMANANTVATSHATANAAQAYEASCHAFTTVRVRISAFTSAGAHTVRITGSTTAIEPAPNTEPSATTTPVTTTPVAPSAISLNSAATTNATSSKATAGSLFEISAANMTAAVKYLKLYNKATAPTVGTDVPVLTIPIPANGYVMLEFGATGKRFTTGIAFALTGAQAIADTTALAAGDVQVHGSYV